MKSALDLYTQCVPDHELLRPIAAGAYGEVWLARNAVGTLRAVKIVLHDQHASLESFEREFKGLQKFEPVSRSHEGFVDILTLGMLPGGAGFYYVMELAEDIRDPTGNSGRDANASGGSVECYQPRTLRAELKSRGALPADDVIALGVKLAAALSHLHAHDLVHRDVKPSNILFVGGDPKLGDAGLVAAVDDARSLVGTAGYIAPEGPGTPQADLYAFGKVLYEAAFGKDRQEFPALPSDVASRPDHARLLELNAILLKACAHDSRLRYQTAEAMRADLELLEHGKSVTRQRFWQSVAGIATKVAALGVLVVAAIITYVSGSKTTPLSEIGWSKNEEANALCREGWNAYHQNSDDAIRAAAELFDRALTIDPGFARAHARWVLAATWLDVTNPDVLERARPHAERALLLEPRLDEAHHAMAGIKTLLTHDWRGAEREALEAIRLNPSSDENYYAYAGPLSLRGQHTEALAQVEKALRLSSPSLISEQFAAFVYLGARKYDQVIRLMNEIIGRQPSSRRRLTTRFLMSAYQGKGDYLKAIELEEESEQLSAKDATAVKTKYDGLRTAFARNGPLGYWQTQLEWRQAADDRDPIQLAILYARVGNKPKAFQYLDLAVERTPLNLCFVLNREPAFDALRGDSHFKDILRRFGLAN